MKLLNKYTVSGLLTILLMTHCSKEEALPSLFPNAGSDQLELVNEGYQAQIATTELFEGQTGSWKVVRGVGGSLDSAASPSTIFRGEPGELYTLEWELREGSVYATDWVDIGFLPMKNEIYTILPDTISDSFTLHLEADSAKYGAIGTWHMIGEDSTGSFSDVNDPNAEFVGLPNHTYTIAYTHTYGSKEVSDEVTVTFDSLQADAGEDNLSIITKEAPYFFTLQANHQEGAAGMWRIIEGEGGNVITPELPNSLFTGNQNEEYHLEWSVSHGDYSDKDTVIIAFGGIHSSWTDARDNKTYKTIKIGNVEWMAENYDFDAYVGEAAWYYGQAAEAINETGHIVSSDEDRRKYGKLYSYNAAALSAPEGWRIPSYDEWWSLVERFNGQSYAGDALRKGGESGVDLELAGYFEMPEYRNSPEFGQLEQMGRYWVRLSDGATLDDEYPQAFQINDGPLVGIAIFIPYYALSVRYIRDIQR
ncbi:FISUMP domain-containing protein [Flammeovirga agarivorans]|uniref:Fibrobacter succinogenes major paralogous domain-containing protein n=1 Tax=Flammeovirga agarivorans TaxID=2726742 RepID=A0A7X8XWA3_9BACT|nr:FISUMP domain-containing protein [Flammeovirga agarivorans]NLR92132.1 hypothetical protein [Flammeovirga agarivorans]